MATVNLGNVFPQDDTGLLFLKKSYLDCFLPIVFMVQVVIAICTVAIVTELPICKAITVSVKKKNNKKISDAWSIQCRVSDFFLLPSCVSNHTESLKCWEKLLDMEGATCWTFIWNIYPNLCKHTLVPLFMSVSILTLGLAGILNMTWAIKIVQVLQREQIN